MLCIYISFRIVTTLVYYGLSLNATTFGHGDEEIRPFVDFILSALVEIPGNFMTLYVISNMINYLGTYLLLLLLFREFVS